jgi:hypothetical protein
VMPVSGIWNLSPAKGFPLGARYRAPAYRAGAFLCGVSAMARGLLDRQRTQIARDVFVRLGIVKLGHDL